MNTHHPFWSWFTANEKTLRKVHSLSDHEREELLYWFSQHLKYYSTTIGHRLIIPFEVGEPARLSFATYGRPKGRVMVLKLMEAAPKLPYWIISASIPSMSDQDPDYFEKEYCLNGICLKPSGIKFWGMFLDPDTDQFILGICLDFPIHKFDPDLLHEVVAIIITDTLGEEKFERLIEAFFIQTELPKGEELLELKDLKIYLEGY